MPAVSVEDERPGKLPGFELGQGHRALRDMLVIAVRRGRIKVDLDLKVVLVAAKIRGADLDLSPAVQLRRFALLYLRLVDRRELRLIEPLVDNEEA